MLKRVLCCGLAVLMVASLAACKKDPQKGSHYSVVWEEEVVDGDVMNGEVDENKKNNASGDQGTASTQGTASDGKSAKSAKKGNSSNGNTNKTSSKAKDSAGTNKNIGNAEKMKYSLIFGGMTVTIMREWAKYANGKNTAHDNFNKWLAKSAKRFNVKIVEKKQKTNLAGEMLAGVKPEGQLYLTRDNVISLSTKGYIADLNKAMKETGITMEEDVYNEVNVALGNFNGKQYSIGLGFARVGAAILYNKKMTEKAGYNIQELVDKKQWTWDKMTEVAKKTTIRDNSGNVTQYGIGLSGRAPVALAASNGGHFAYPDSNGVFKSYLTSQNTIEALDLCYKWFVTDKVATYNFNGQWTALDDQFADKKICMLFCSHNSVSTAYKKLNADDYGVAYLPMGPRAKGYVSYLTPEYYYLIPSSYQDMTTELLLLADELHQWPVEGYTRDDEFRDEWGARYFHSNDQYKMWKNLHFGNATTRVWDGSVLVGTTGEDGADISALLKGEMTGTTWAQTNNSSLQKECDDIAKTVKYTGKLR